jgi:DNA polymerase elongation subunit (family B)
MYHKDGMSPCFYMDVIDIKNDGIDDVFDIIDVPDHSFFANGVVAHNCCTYMGRVNIEKVADVITTKYKGQLVYGDTDSNYITFPHLKTKTARETWDYAEMVAEEVSKLFPRPITLDYEQVIYNQFCILTKKRYMYKSMDRDGNIDNKIGKKGVLLARRDNALIIRNIYEKLIEMIFDKKSRDEILYFLLQEINRICSNSVLHKEFVITKAVGDVNNMTMVKIKDEKGKVKMLKMVDDGKTYEEKYGEVNRLEQLIQDKDLEILTQLVKYRHFFWS